MKNIVCGDIGGTNANLSLIDVNGSTPKIITLKKELTQNIKDFPAFVAGFLKENKAEDCSLGCFSIAGPIYCKNNKQSATLTNQILKIDSEKIKEKTKLKQILLLNDFEAISYAINVIDKRILHTINKGKPKKGASKAVIGAGTGLGAAMLIYDKHNKLYRPLPSEYGHSDLIQENLDSKMLAFIKKRMKRKNHLDYEELLSGRGLESIYGYMQKFYVNVPRNLSATQVAETRKSNACSKKAFEIFIKHTAIFARNFSLAGLPSGGLYIAGGIASQNDGAFDKFMPEFIKHSREQISNVLKDMPVHIITDYYINHIGAAYAITKQEVFL